jgi:3-hydroxyacyl-CoA dehydrogenase/enoyl-CoA hydratase/3-hydroxybutyryl-CoA epimerase
MPVRYEKGDDDIVTLTFDAPGAPVNTMTAAWQEAYTAAVARLEKEKNDIAGLAPTA